jgi:hypothetical protein
VPWLLLVLQICIIAVVTPSKGECVPQKVRERTADVQGNREEVGVTWDG